MASIWVPALLRALTGGADVLTVDAATLGEAIDQLDTQFPGLKERLVVEDRIKPNLSVVVDGVSSRKGLRQPLTDENEVHFVPALTGG
jgi:sulfur-carrier protein